MGLFSSLIILELEELELELEELKVSRELEELELEELEDESDLVVSRDTPRIN
jgi:hypothetical protein